MLLALCKDLFYVWPLEGCHYEQFYIHRFIIIWHSIILQQGKPPTKVLLDGEWIVAQRNVGEDMREHYGPEVYRHVEHKMLLPSGTHREHTRHFTTCPTPGRHDCLDQYSTDGNLQFSDPTP